MDTQNYGLEKVIPFKYGHFWLDFWGVYRDINRVFCSVRFLCQMSSALWLCMAIGRSRCQDHPIEEVMDYIDWTPFFQADDVLHLLGVSLND